MNLAATLHHAALRYSSAPALYQGEKCVCTYRDWAFDVVSMAAGLQRIYGCAVGDRVCIAMANQPSYLTVLYACWHAGLCVVPINAKLHAQEMSFIIDDCEARIFICDQVVAEQWKKQPPDIQKKAPWINVDEDEFSSLFSTPFGSIVDVPSDTPAWLFFTSGTTGKPKGAILSHRNLMAMSLSYFADYGGINPEDRIVHAAPCSHGSGLYALPFTMKGAGHVFPESRRFSPAEFIKLVNVHGNSSAFLAPTMVTRLMNTEEIASLDLNRLKQIIYGGAPMFLEDIKRALAVFGPRLAQLYGQGECPMTISYISRDEHIKNGSQASDEVLQSVGWPRTGVEIRIVSNDGVAVRPGEIGEITVQGDTVMRGYWNNPIATDWALRDGWLYTGDLGVINATGMLTLKGRSKEVIISGGTNIYPREIEDVMLEHPAIKEVAVVGLPDPDWGEVVAAFIKKNSNTPLNADDILPILSARLARFKHPKKFIFVASIPKNANGKIDKIYLKEDFLRASGSCG